MKKRQFKILLIDDEPALQNILKMKFEQEGYQFFGALSGKEGLAIVKKEKPDLILLDIIIPEVDGFEIFAKLKRIPEAKNSKVVILSNSGKDEDIERGKEMGAADYLVKTRFSLEEMMEKVRKYLKEKC